MEFPNLLRKYSQPAPRYTSYPTVPEWESDQFRKQNWEEALVSFWEGDQKDAPAQVYIHLPFCESLCTFCACNKRITKNHAVEGPYIETVLEEWNRYVTLHGGPIPVSEIHLGGGTPTFFSEASLGKLITGILARALPAEGFEMAIEVHPGTTTPSMIRHLASLGFRRISIGVQDFSPFILERINRHQTFEQTRDLVSEARSSGFESINFDLVYGLPFQTESHVTDTIEKVLSLHPDRIAFYGYAHVPWKSKGQRRYTEEDLPEALQRWGLFHTGKELLGKAGYLPIGLDHFAKPTDALFRAAASGNLHRNFMGYTEHHAPLILGLGASAIGETPDAYAQNFPVLEDYQEALKSEGFPVSKGHSLTRQDQVWKEHIMDLMCRQKTRIGNDEDWENAIGRLDEMQKEGLVEISGSTLSITPKGIPFMRTACMNLDQRHWAATERKALFSAAV